MARVRQLFLTLASGSALYSGLAPALGLGEVTLHSALNQPLSAEIVLLDAGDLTADELNIGLASVAAFKSAGVDRLQFLDDLRFTPLWQGNHTLIRVTSNKPVREPYLNFIVEVQRANGRLLREYTLLIDPPSSLAERSASAALRSTATAVESPALQLPSRQSLPAAGQGQRYQVSSGDSLWKIASKLRQGNSQSSQLQVMADIHALNPQAFIGGDINRLKVGASLLLPDGLSTSEQGQVAVAEGVGATANEVPASAPELPAVASSDALMAVQRRLDESLAESEIERLQLQQQMSDLQVQLTQLQLQVEQKDQQVAALQTQVDASAPVNSEALMTESIEPVQLPAETTVESGQPQAPASNNLFAWLAGAILAFLAGALLWWRQRSAKVPPTLSSPAAKPVESAVVGGAALGVGRARLVASARVLVEPSDATTEALDGANIYMAYGRFDEARDALLRILAKAPERIDVRLRLLEALAELGDAQGFAEHEQWLLSAGEAEGDIVRIKTAYPTLASNQVTDALDNLQLDLPEPAPTQANNETLLDAPLNLDDLSLDADWSLISPFDRATPSKPAKAQVIEAQFSSDLRSLPEVFELHDEADGFDAVLAESFIEDEKLDDRFEELPSRASASLDDLAGSPENVTRLNMALAYIEQGSLESACNILNQVINDGDAQQKQQAREILERIA